MYTNLETLKRCQKNRENEKTDVYICEKVKGIDEIKGRRIKRMKREIYNQYNLGKDQIIVQSFIQLVKNNSYTSK